MIYLLSSEINKNAFTVVKLHRQQSIIIIHLPKISSQTQVDKKDRVLKFKNELLKMIAQSKQIWDKWLSSKQIQIAKMRKEHRSRLENMLKEIQILRKACYEQFKHICNTKKQGFCGTCIRRQKHMKQKITEYLKSQATDNNRTKQIKKIFALSKKDKLSKILEQPPLETDKIQMKQDYRRSGSQRQINENIKDFNTLLSTKISQESKDRLAMFQRNLRRNQSSFKLDTGDNQKNYGEYIRTSKRKPTDFGRLNKGNQIDFDSLRNKGKNINQSQDYNFRRSSKFQGRKSVIQIVQPQETENISSNVKSRFQTYQEKFEADLEPAFEPKQQVNNEVKKSIKVSKKTVKVTTPQSIERESVSPVVDRRSNMKKKATKYKSVKIDRKIEDTQFYVQIEQPESIRRIEPVVIETNKIAKSKKVELVSKLQISNKKKQRAPKLSRYKREKLFYTMLKKQLVNTNTEIEQEQQDPIKIRSLFPSVIFEHQRQNQESTSQDQKYSVKQRKQSLISKLRIFNQSVNFQEVKDKISAALENKDDFILQHAGKELLVLQSLESNSEQKSKIVEMFLGDVLKISDLKQLLKKKFSKQTNWDQRMRDMHQFYTYIEYSLQKFRSAQILNTQDKWRSISCQGKDLDMDVDQLQLTEDIGHYEGLENVGLNEFQHLREIQCSVKYYGLQVKRQIDQPEFIYNDPVKIVQPEEEKVAQKSLKSIQEVFQEEHNQCATQEIVCL